MARLSDRSLFLLSMAGHFLLQVVTFLWMFSLGMGRVESKAPAELLEMTLTTITGVLAFPFTLALVTFGSGIFQGQLGWIPVLSNSALWAGAAVLLRRYFVSLRSRHAV